MNPEDCASRAFPIAEMIALPQEPHKDNQRTDGIVLASVVLPIVEAVLFITWAVLLTLFHPA
jgi:hypothetical protein